jgi:predicted ATPase/DNA-binding SARP family transcriptional activator
MASTSPFSHPNKPGHLPLLLSSFIGREREIAEVKQTLVSHRLLTLTGTGGCGKTRLSLEVAAGLVEEFEDHIWVVGLVALSEPSLVPQSVASTLGLREQPERALTEMIIDFLHPRRALLVLDNCEHLIHACATLVQTLLATCPRLHILATSRESLGLPGETIWPVPSLSFPDPQHLPPLESLKQYDAIHLFVDRTADVLPSFVLTSQNAPVVAQICQRLDGIPLAIELAAARMRVLSVEQLAARLDSSFHLLTGGSRIALPRQQTLRATIDWSYDLLSEHERALFHRLSVFAGGSTLEAAEAICAGAKLEQHAVLELLSSLINKSMVVVVEQGDEARYRLLETTRQYAWEKLTASGEVESIRLNHAHFFLRLAEMAEPKLKSAVRRLWLERLEREYDNLRTALTWLREHGEMERGLQLAAALTWFWYFRGYISEARQWLEGTLALREASGRTPGRAKALFAAGCMAWVQGEYAKAYAHLDESVAIWREVKDRQDLAYSLTLLGVVTELQGDHTAARVLQEESLAVFREVGDTWGLALALDWLGYTMRVQRDHARARSLFEESRALFREVGDKWGLSHTLHGLGAVVYRQGNDAQACSLLEEALALRREVGDRWQLAQSLDTLGVVVQHQGDYGRACVLFEESLGLYREVGDMLGVIFSLRYLGEIAQYQGDYERATTLFQERLLLSRQIGHKRRIVECLEELARVAEAQGYFIRALQLFGATDALLTPISARVLPDDHTGYDRNVAAIRTQLPAEVYTATWAEGQTMTMEQAIEYALTESAKSDLTAPRPMAADLTTKPTALVEEKAGPALRIFAFGPGRVYRGEYALTTSDWIYSKVRELLFYLLCSASRTKEQIGLALWPDASPAQLRSNLHNTLYHLRHILSRPEWIVFEHNNYTFNRQLPYWFDVEAFESHLAGARQLQVNAPAQAIHALEEAVKLYQGDFLEDMVTGDWPLVRRDALRRMYLEALLALGQLCFADGRYAEATEAYRQAIAHDSYQEVAHRELMRCYVRQGERGQALRHYQSLLEWMRDELGSPPAPETTALYERLRQGKDD